MYGAKVKVEEKIHNLQEYVEILETARTNPSSFILKHGPPLLKNWSQGFKNLFEKKMMSNKAAFEIMSYCRIKYPASGGVLVASSYFGAYQPFSYFKRNEVAANLYQTLKSAETVAIHPKKGKDVRNLFRILTAENVQWFEKVFEDSYEATVTLNGEEETMALLGYPEDDPTE